MFLNLSNHPSAEWSGPQMEHARRLGGSIEIMDLPFPHVDPAWDTEQVAEVARAVARRALVTGAKAALVEGEFVLTLALVLLLEKAGLPCYAASSPRIAAQTKLPDGSVRKTVHFEFVRFRRYWVG